MRILITNDDGINAPGLAVLAAIAEDLAGPDGEVWTVAPAFEQSGVGHAISFVHPTLLAELGPRRWAAEGSPADCVLAGLHEVMAEAPPDLVLSGVNRGNNSGENVVYSGTIGAAMEAALQGVPSIALSQYFGAANRGLDDPFEAAASYGAELVRRLLAFRDRDGAEYRLFYNVNFPPVPASDVKGVAIVRQGTRHGVRMTAETYRSPSGRHFVWVHGGDQTAPAASGTDISANLEGYISVTPLRADLTAHDVLGPLGEALA